MKTPAGLFVAGACSAAVGRAAAHGRLPRNRLVGIRIPSTMGSDEAWRAGHRAAAGALTLAGVGPIAAAAVTAWLKPDQEVQTQLERFAGRWLLVWLAVATSRASRAARSIVA